MGILKLLKSNNSKRIKTYKLEDFARIWTTVENEDQDLKVTPAEGFESNENQIPIIWRNPQISLFWTQYIDPYTTFLNLVPGQLQVIQKTLLELELNGNCKSIVSDDNETPAKYKVLTKVNLRDHCLAVAKRMVEIIQDRNDLKILIGKALIVGLGHDMGMLHKAMPNAAHSHNSAIWMKNQLNGMKHSKLILEAIRWHHSTNKKIHTNNHLAGILVQADHEVRLQELRELEQKPDETSVANHEVKFRSPYENSSIAKQDQKDQPSINANEFLKKLTGKIGPVGFDAFSFKAETYISPKIIREILTEAGLDTSDIIKMDDLVRAISNTGINFKTGKFRLRFMNRKMPPRDRYYLVIDNDALGTIDKAEQIPPRDTEGRWLKKIVAVEARGEK